MDLKDVFDEIVKRMQRAREKEIRPEIVRGAGEYTINLSDEKKPFGIMLKEYPHGVTVSARRDSERCPTSYSGGNHTCLREVPTLNDGIGPQEKGALNGRT
jgi:hypothetical protein